MKGPREEWIPPLAGRQWRVRARLRGWRDRVHPRVVRFYHSGEWMGHSLYLGAVSWEAHGKYYAVAASVLFTLRLVAVILLPSEMDQHDA